MVNCSLDILFVLSEIFRFASIFLGELRIYSFFKKIYFIYFWLHWVFVAACGLSLVAASRGHSSLWCAGLSLRWPLSLQSTGSRRAGPSSCGTQAQLLLSTWDSPGPGLESMSPALAGGLPTTAPPGKPRTYSFDIKLSLSFGVRVRLILSLCYFCFQCCMFHSFILCNGYQFVFQHCFKHIISIFAILFSLYFTAFFLTKQLLRIVF